jgi:hypothetical protein
MKIFCHRVAASRQSAAGKSNGSECGALPSRRYCRGVSLIECLVYIAVFALMLGGGTAAFYFCWDHTRSVIFTSGEIESALHTGEAWRADVRAATGKIFVETSAVGSTVKIPEGKNEVTYRFVDDQLFRETSAPQHSRVLLERVKVSEVKSTARGGLDAWRWELELQPRQAETRSPLCFTFEAAQAKP